MPAPDTCANLPALLLRHAQQRTAGQTRDPDRYQIIAEHGRGGLGRVSRAHDRDLGRDVAIKELISRSSIGEIRFLREALITARLEHPGIVPVHEAGRWPDGTPFYAMKLVAGRPLRDLIAERSTVASRLELLHHVVAVADALAYAHGRNIIHRDLKPANVIVGDFGETIVIDWGLAKDLSVSSLPSGDGAPFRSERNDDLTAAGSILGTPAYMAPEQERGTRVDQRADVFAIGAMLWELCSLHKVPPSDLGVRHRLLRREGIDRDLVIIIDKALDPDPAGRYPHAGALASDLRAFQTGAHIAARHYSLLAMLLHWTRRHRALATLAGLALVAMAGSGLFYVRNIARERTRADSALVREAGTKQQLEDEHDELTLKHAQLLLASDPTAALDLLASYRGRHGFRAEQLRAEAIDRGVSSLRAAPHSDNILWLQGLSDGTIVSLSLDGNIARTRTDGTVEVLARNVSPRVTSAYSPDLHVLAYICDPARLCILDIRDGHPLPVPDKWRGSQLAGLDFSPDGRLLALISDTGDLRVLDLSHTQHVTERLHVANLGGSAVLFVDQDSVAVGTADGMSVIGMSGVAHKLRDPDGMLWASNAADHLLAITTKQGDGYLVEPSTLTAMDRIKLCHDLVTSIQIIQGARAIVFACQEGTVGLWNLSARTTMSLTHVDGHANKLTIDSTRSLILATSDSGTLTVYDLRTRLATQLRGHTYRITAVSPPSTEYPYLVSGDVHGTLRTWRLPQRHAAMVGDAYTRMFGAAYHRSSGKVLASTLDSALRVFPVASTPSETPHHRENHAYLQLSEDEKHFATYGDADDIEIWSTTAMSVEYTIPTNHGSVSDLVFIPGSGDLVTAGRDGRVVRWSHRTLGREVASFELPITMLRTANRGRDLIARTEDGLAWLVVEGTPARQISPNQARVTTMVDAPDHGSFWLGLADGRLLSVDTQTWVSTAILRATNSIRDVAFTSDGQTIAVAANDESVRISTRTRNGWTKDDSAWITLVARARRVVFTADGTLVVACANGVAWLYSSAERSWRHVSLGTGDLTHAIPRSTADALIFDSNGRVYSVETESTKSQFKPESH